MAVAGYRLAEGERVNDVRVSEISISLEMLCSCVTFSNLLKVGLLQQV